MKHDKAVDGFMPIRIRLSMQIDEKIDKQIFMFLQT